MWITAGKERFMAVFNGVFDRQQIREFVEAVIARGGVGV
ncbi:MAG: hypothetical protein KatS3mg052_1420 [Candidatus Roseilinea sp.]|nr:MAG: hypothetical protein KatS3mg052_1420 [Candidatus Roseilinea sp.]